MTVPVRELLEARGPGRSALAARRGRARPRPADRAARASSSRASRSPASCRSSIPTASRCSATARSATSATLDRRERRGAAVAAVAGAGVACFVVTNGTPPPGGPDRAGRGGGRRRARARRCARATSSARATAWLEERLAPETTLHGELVEVHGLGVLILGKSGIGKSEAALDLVSRGHRLVADDVVLVRRISPTVLRGRAAELLAHHMEIRGLGVIDIEALFGTLATLDERQIDLVVELIEWADERRPPRARSRSTYTLLDVALPLVRIPVTAGPEPRRCSSRPRRATSCCAGAAATARADFAGAARPRDAARRPRRVTGAAR